jgi:hypothetical protein
MLILIAVFLRFAGTAFRAASWLAPVRVARALIGCRARPYPSAPVTAALSPHPLAPHTARWTRDRPASRGADLIKARPRAWRLAPTVADALAGAPRGHGASRRPGPARHGAGSVAGAAPSTSLLPLAPLPPRPLLPIPLASNPSLSSLSPRLPPPSSCHLSPLSPLPAPLSPLLAPCSLLRHPPPPATQLLPSSGMEGGKGCGWGEVRNEQS